MERQTRQLIEWECQQFLNRITNLIDSERWEELANCYTDNGVLFRPSDPHNGVEGRAAILQSLRDRPPRTTCHLLANTTFDVHSDKSVTAFSRVWLVSGPASESLPVQADSKLMVGSFTDELTLTDEGWKLTCRRGGIELKYDPSSAS